MSLAEVEVCKMVGITPASYYNLQTKEEYLAYQTDFADRVDDLSKKYRKLDETQRATKILNDVKRYLLSHREGSQGLMLAWHGELEGNDDNRGSVMAERLGKKWILKTFLCFDEARECIDYEESQLFRSLRHVLRDRFERTKTPQESLPQGDFFGIFLDTTSRVTNFSPPVHLDSSQEVVDRMGNGRTLLPPIYQIKTMDIFAEEDDTEEDGSAKAAVKFFRFGGPLWGSRCHPDSVPKDPASELISLASQKTDGDSLAKALALISYRLEFYLASSHLADEMYRTASGKLLLSTRKGI